ncbi:hypothetical protein E4T47_04037 [Aureobasidium subglaciale]|nr:hypothetical protein E4T47_04037 [Aureobasidium subglaciale]
MVRDRMPSHEVKFLTGAPAAASLDWRNEGLLNTFSSALQRHLHQSHSGLPSTPGPTQPVAKWRSIPLATKRIFHESPVLQKKPAQPIVSALPRQVSNLRPVSDRHDDYDDFLDHSFALEADLQSSQIAPQDHNLDHDEEQATFMTDDSVDSTFLDDCNTTFLSTEASIVEDSGPRTSAPQRLSGPIMSLNAVPKAEYLHHLEPQTMTVNLLVGIISVAPARTVTTRKGGYNMDIIELTVGDEAKAGFTISSWHSAVDSGRKDADQSRAILQSLRSQDIVLIERVALSSFRGAVFGQSLNRRATKNTTTFTVLHKAHDYRVDSAQHSNMSLAIENKLEKVREWVASFVGPSAKRKAQSEPLPLVGQKSKKSKKGAMIEEFLPADSQP